MGNYHCWSKLNMYLRFCVPARTSDCSECAVLLCLVCLTLLLSFFLPSHLSLKHVCIKLYLYTCKIYKFCVSLSSGYRKGGGIGIEGYRHRNRGSWKHHLQGTGYMYMYMPLL